MRHSTPPRANSALAVSLSETLKAPDAVRVRRRNTLYGPWVPLGFVLPALLYLGAMFGYPLYYSVSMSVRHFTVASFLTGAAPFVGLRNYLDLFTDRLFLAALGKTAVFTVLSIAGQMTVGMLLALFFRRAFPLSSAMRA